ncbi:response regulator transcription factor [Planctobacterium marinum]|uniref:DNA-binding response regulator n=1 Tax=Planctobacterium marinum TaxID=1631968 RepID=A0AA48KQQ7_9ALTE|nr:DNA-binding response regulator [Planctobacterium marinum]
MSSILLVEDDRDMSSLVEEFLTDSGFNVTAVETAKDCFTRIANAHFDIVLLDLTLPDEDGLVILRKLVKRTVTPIVIISGRKTDDDKVAGLELGAKDYLGKPFSLKELLIRVKNVLGLPLSVEKQNTELMFHNFVLSQKSRSLFDIAGNRIELTQHEFKVLSTLAQRKNEVVPREEIVELVSDLDIPENNRAVDISISRLRKKLNDNRKPFKIIQTIRGEGYLLST